MALASAPQLDAVKAAAVGTTDIPIYDALTIFFFEI